MELHICKTFWIPDSERNEDTSIDYEALPVPGPSGESKFQ